MRRLGVAIGLSLCPGAGLGVGAGVRLLGGAAAGRQRLEPRHLCLALGDARLGVVARVRDQPRRRLHRLVQGRRLHRRQQPLRAVRRAHLVQGRQPVSRRPAERIARRPAVRRAEHGVRGLRAPAHRPRRAAPGGAGPDGRRNGAVVGADRLPRQRVPRLVRQRHPEDQQRRALRARGGQRLLQPDRVRRAHRRQQRHRRRHRRQHLLQRLRGQRARERQRHQLLHRHQGQQRRRRRPDRQRAHHRAPQRVPELGRRRRVQLRAGGGGRAALPRGAGRCWWRTT